MLVHSGGLKNVRASGEMLSPTTSELSAVTELNLENTLNTYTEPPHCINILLWCVALSQILLVAH